MRVLAFLELYAVLDIIFCKKYQEIYIKAKSQMFIFFFEESLVHKNRNQNKNHDLILFIKDLRPFGIAENWFRCGFGPLYLIRLNMSHGFLVFFGSKSDYVSIKKLNNFENCSKFWSKYLNNKEIFQSCILLFYIFSTFY